MLDVQQFITLGVLRRLQEVTTLRESVQVVLHLVQSARGQVAPGALDLLRCAGIGAALANPARFGDEPGAPAGHGAGGASDRGSRFGCACCYGRRQHYPEPSARTTQWPPRRGGRHDPKSEGLLAIFTLRLDAAVDALVELHNPLEQALVRDCYQDPSALTNRRRAILLVDRAFIHAGSWDAKNAKLRIARNTRLKANPRIDTSAPQATAAEPVNDSVASDPLARLALR